MRLRESNRCSPSIAEYVRIVYSTLFIPYVCLVFMVVTRQTINTPIQRIAILKDSAEDQSEETLIVRKRPKCESDSVLHSSHGAQIRL